MPSPLRPALGDGPPRTGSESAVGSRAARVVGDIACPLYTFRSKRRRVITNSPEEPCLGSLFLHSRGSGSGTSGRSWPSSPSWDTGTSVGRCANASGSRTPPMLRLTDESRPNTTRPGTARSNEQRRSAVRPTPAPDVKRPASCAPRPRAAPVRSRVRSCAPAAAAVQMRSTPGRNRTLVQTDSRLPVSHHVQHCIRVPPPRASRAKGSEPANGMLGPSGRGGRHHAVEGTRMLQNMRLACV